jgi:cytochrome c556
MQRGNPLFFAVLTLSLAACSPPPAAPPQAAAAPQEAPRGSDPGWTGLTAPEEVIEARRVLMTQTERLMKPVDGFIVGEPADGALLRENAAAIEAMLLALPHLFPPTTNLFDSAALDPPTVALPTIWQRFAAFETFAASAEGAAAALATAEDGEPLRAASERLRAACDRCHAAFMKPYTPPVVTDEDLNFDFESVLPSE